MGERIAPRNQVDAFMAERSGRVRSTRQLEVYALRGQGLSLKQIAAHLGIAYETVRTYVRRYTRTARARAYSNPATSAAA